MQYVDRFPILLRVRAEIKREAKAAALRQNRSMNSYLEFLILQDLGLELPLEANPKEGAETMTF